MRLARASVAVVLKVVYQICSAYCIWYEKYYELL